MIEIVECSYEDFSNEELLITVHDKDLKLNDSDPTKVQCLEIEACFVHVHVASDLSVMTSIGPEVHFAPNGIAVQQRETVEENLKIYYKRIKKIKYFNF
jgi:hypothetical protein